MILNYHDQIQVQWQKLSGIDAQYVKIGKKLAIPGNIQSSRKFLEVSRNDEILKFCVENQVSWHKLSGIYTLHVDISQN